MPLIRGSNSSLRRKGGRVKEYENGGVIQRVRHGKEKKTRETEREINIAPEGQSKNFVGLPEASSRWSVIRTHATATPNLQRNNIRRKYMYFYCDNPPIPVCKLVAEESEKSDILDSTLSCGLCGVVGAAGCGGSRH